MYPEPPPTPFAAVRGREARVEQSGKGGAIAAMAATMSREPAASSDHERPPTPPSSVRLQSIRYEDAANGSPPVPVASIGALRAPLASNSPPRAGHLASSQKRPRTSPNPSSAPLDRASYLSEDPKRDSGVAPSLLTPGTDSYVASGAAEAPSVPTIVVDDAQAKDQGGRHTGSNCRKTKEPERPKTAHPTHQRLRSFHGIEAEIPSGDFGDFGDLASDKVTFSNRGSLLFGGKKMQEMLNKKLAENPQPEANEEKASMEEASTNPEVPAGDEPSKAGLQSGRRKPSVHMLQAAIAGGRVLSAEEMTLSMKVRSMYEYGDERAAEWNSSTIDMSAEVGTSDGSTRDTSSPSLHNDQGLSIDKSRLGASSLKSASPSSANVRASYAREPTELAGGVEDWRDIQNGVTDRWGFIVHERPASNGSSAQGTPVRNQVQRVATALQLATTQPRRERKLRRKISMARSSRSVPPKSSVDNLSSRGAGSVHSYTSGNSRAASTNPFKSKNRRITEGAGDMLRLPPGLADVAEQEDGGKTVDAARRRERERESKWRAMARSTRPSGSAKGGGMHFEFDTSDPKLIERTWKGIPDSIRGMVWHSFLSTSARKRGNCASDDELYSAYRRLLKMKCADDVQIDVDVPRTINMHIMFRRRYRGGQKMLFNVLHAITLWSPDTGYVQGMATLAATLLVYCHEELAFVMMVRLWTLRGLDQLFQPGFEGLMAALAEFEKDWLGTGPVASKLTELGIPSTSYGTRWYLTLFNMSLPYQAQLRVWDVFMLLGDATSPLANPAFGGADLDVLHATSAALIDATQEIVLDSDFEEVMKILTSFVPIKDEDMLMRVAMVEWKMRKKRGGMKT